MGIDKPGKRSSVELPERRDDIDKAQPERGGDVLSSDPALPLAEAQHVVDLQLAARRLEQIAHSPLDAAALSRGLHAGIDVKVAILAKPFTIPKKNQRKIFGEQLKKLEITDLHFQLVDKKNIQQTYQQAWSYLLQFTPEQIAEDPNLKNLALLLVRYEDSEIDYANMDDVFSTIQCLKYYRIITADLDANLSLFEAAGELLNKLGDYYQLDPEIIRECLVEINDLADVAILLDSISASTHIRNQNPALINLIRVFQILRTRNFTREELADLIGTFNPRLLERMYYSRIIRVLATYDKSTHLALISFLSRAMTLSQDPVFSRLLDSVYSLLNSPSKDALQRVADVWNTPSNERNIINRYEVYSFRLSIEGLPHVVIFYSGRYRYMQAIAMDGPSLLADTLTEPTPMEFSDLSSRLDVIAQSPNIRGNEDFDWINPAAIELNDYQVLLGQHYSGETHRLLQQLHQDLNRAAELTNSHEDAMSAVDLSKLRLRLVTTRHYLNNQVLQNQVSQFKYLYTIVGELPRDTEDLALLNQLQIQLQATINEPTLRRLVFNDALIIAVARRLFSHYVPAALQDAIKPADFALELASWFGKVPILHKRSNPAAATFQMAELFSELAAMLPGIGRMRQSSLDNYLLSTIQVNDHFIIGQAPKFEDLVKQIKDDLRFYARVFADKAAAVFFNQQSYSVRLFSIGDLDFEIRLRRGVHEIASGLSLEIALSTDRDSKDSLVKRAYSVDYLFRLGIQSEDQVIKIVNVQAANDGNLENAFYNPHQRSTEVLNDLLKVHTQGLLATDYLIAMAIHWAKTLGIKQVLGVSNKANWATVHNKATSGRDGPYDALFRRFGFVKPEAAADYWTLSLDPFNISHNKSANNSAVDPRCHAKYDDLGFADFIRQILARSRMGRSADWDKTNPTPVNPRVQSFWKIWASALEKIKAQFSKP